jgi:voltage-gated potassium channel
VALKQAGEPLDPPDLVADQIAGLNNHYILCGVGRTGYYIIERLFEIQLPFVVIEQDITVLDDLKARLHERAEKLLYIQGDATEEETLDRAGVSRAGGLIATLSDDKDNLFVTLTARSLNPQMRIVAKVEDDRVNREKLIKAGADRVISSNVIGGMRMASEMIRPRVAHFLDQLAHASDKKSVVHFTELPLAAIKISPLAALIEAQQQDPEAAGITIRDIGKHTGLLVVAIKSPESGDDDAPFSRYHFAPRGDAELRPGDVLVIVGTQEKLDEVTGNEKRKT